MHRVHASPFIQKLTITNNIQARSYLGLLDTVVFPKHHYRFGRSEQDFDNKDGQKYYIDANE